MRRSAKKTIKRGPQSAGGQQHTWARTPLSRHWRTPLGARERSMGGTNFMMVCVLGHSQKYQISPCLFSLPEKFLITILLLNFAENGNMCFDLSLGWQQPRFQHPVPFQSFCQGEPHGQ